MFRPLGAVLLALALAGCAATGVAADGGAAHEESARTAEPPSISKRPFGEEGDCFFMRQAFVESAGGREGARHCEGEASAAFPKHEAPPEPLRIYREQFAGWGDVAGVTDWRVSRPSWLPPDRRRVGLHTEEMRAEPGADPEPIGVSTLYGPAEGQPRPGELIGLKQWVDHGHGQDNIAADAAAARDAGLRVEEHEIAGASAYLIHGGVTIDGDAHDDIALRWSDGEVVYRLHAPSSEHREDLLRIARSLEPVR